MKCIELGKSLQGGDDSFGTTLKEIVKEAAPAIAQMLTARAPAAGAPQQQIAESPESQKEALDAQMKLGIAFLKKKCINGADPGLYIDLIIDNREEASYAGLIHGIISKDFATFAGLDPEIALPAFEPFFRSIYDGLRSAFNPADSVAVHSAGTARNPADVAGHGKSGQSGGKR